MSYSEDQTFLLSVFLPLLFVPISWFLGKRLKKNLGFFVTLIPLFIFLNFLNLYFLHCQNGVFSHSIIKAWVPSLGLNLNFLIDGLSLFYGMVVTGVGTFVFLYSSFYLDNHYRYHNRFYSYLLLFLFAMLGTVFSGNLLLLFIFWELTGIASFFLIGFLHEKEESRSGARMALLVTGMTGLVFLLGIILTKQVFGTYDILQLYRLAENIQIFENNAVLQIALVLLLIGAFGKSAQFPFHFWLPNAMAAPTPVSSSNAQYGFFYQCLHKSLSIRTQS